MKRHLLIFGVLVLCGGCVGEELTPQDVGRISQLCRPASIYAYRGGFGRVYFDVECENGDVLRVRFANRTEGSNSVR